MSRRYSFDGQEGQQHQHQQQQLPLDRGSDRSPSLPQQPHQQYHQPPPQPQQQQLRHQLQPSYSPANQANHPADTSSYNQLRTHRSHSPDRAGRPLIGGPNSSQANSPTRPDNSFNQLRSQRSYSPGIAGHPRVGGPIPSSPSRRPLASPSPRPPPHRDNYPRESGYTNTNSAAFSDVTHGADNFGERAAGGLAGVAMSVADQNARESGVEAMRNTPGYDPQRQMNLYDDAGYGRPPPSHQPYYDESQFGRHPPPSHQPYYDESQFARPPPARYDESPYSPTRGQYPYEDSPSPRPLHPQASSQSSLAPLGAAAFPPGVATPNSPSITSRSPQSFRDSYTDSHTPYGYSRNLDPSFGSGIDPNMIADDGDDGLEYRQQKRGSLLSVGNHSNRDIPAAAGGAAAGGVLGSIGGLVGRSTPSSNLSYNPVNSYAGSGSGSGRAPNDYEAPVAQEKGEWLEKQQAGRKRWIWLICVLVALAIIGGIAGGVLGPMLSKKDNASASSGASAATAEIDTATNGDLNKNSAEIKKLLGNKNLHKVFPGVDYTPMYTQYPECLDYPASQNNVTRDIAVISQLTNIVRLYGTDCNGTEMTIHAIEQLGLKGKMKIWLGVWQDKDLETNARQLKTMYEIFDRHGADHFVGIILGNEVLFRQDLTITALGTLIQEVKANLTSRSPAISLPVACSDLGDAWTQALADAVDYVMANIHPFFAGVTSEEAAGWTWSFWQNKDVPLKADRSKHIISETGWPSTGGTSCGGAVSCAVGSVAGVTEMNNFMEGWVCPALVNGTNYFLFEAFDEPWKIKFNTPGKEWEDKWGIMDVNRVLKDGIKIPDCGGKTVDGMTFGGVTLG